MDDLLEDSGLNGAFGFANAQQTVRQILLPGIVWRPGKTAASIRFSAVTALVTFFSYDLMDSKSMMEVLETGEFLPLLFQVLEEDHYADTRISGCFVAKQIILIAGTRLIVLWGTKYDSQAPDLSTLEKLNACESYLFMDDYYVYSNLRALRV